MNSNRFKIRMRPLVGSGVLAWVIAKALLLMEYVERVGGWGSVDINLIITTGLTFALDGLITIGALKTPTAQETTQPPVNPASPIKEPNKPKAPVPFRRQSGFKFSVRSLGNLEGLSDFMQRTARRGLAYSRHDWVMIASKRTLAEQILNVKAKVSRTLDSRHCEEPAQAFDILVLDENNNPLDGNSPEHEPYYRRVAEDILEAARDEGGTVTSGILDWGWDWYHFERSRDEVPFEWPEGVDVPLPA